MPQVAALTELTFDDLKDMPKDANINWVMNKISKRRSLVASLHPDIIAQHEVSSPRSSARRKTIAATMAPPIDAESAESSVEGEEGEVNNVLPMPMGNSFVKLSLNGLSFYIGKARVLNDLHTSVKQGQLVGLMGESGAMRT